MICALEIAMLVWGIIVLVTGKLKVSKTKEVRGAVARILGCVLILPFPLAFAVGFIVGFTHPNTVRESTAALAGMEALIVLSCAIVAVVVGLAVGKPPVVAPESTHAFPVEPPQQPPQNPA